MIQASGVSAAMDSNRFASEQSGTQQPANGGTGAPQSAILRLLDPESNQPIDNPELRRELASMVELMQRLETLAHEQLEQNTVASGIDQPPEADEQPLGSHQAEHENQGDPSIAEPFDPAEFTEPPSVSLSYVPDDASASASLPDPHGFELADHPESGTTTKNDDEYLTRWWVHFNGDISLERLARFRNVLSESPFAIDARFSEITDGLILMRLVTEGHFSDAQVDWIIRQVMDAVGLDRGAAILSRD